MSRCTPPWREWGTGPVWSPASSAATTTSSSHGAFSTSSHHSRSVFSTKNSGKVLNTNILLIPRLITELPLFCFYLSNILFTRLGDAAVLMRSSVPSFQSPDFGNDCQNFTPHYCCYYNIYININTTLPGGAAPSLNASILRSWGF